MSKKESPSSKKKKKKIVKLVITLVIAAVLVAGGIIFIPKLLNANDDTGTILQKRTAVVAKGDVVRTIGASAPLDSSESTVYRPEEVSEVIEIMVDDGDYVSEGDVIMLLDTSSTDSSIEALEDQIEIKQGQIDDKKSFIEDKYDAINDRRDDITDKNEEIKDLQEDIAELQSDVDDNEETRTNLNIYAPIDGTIFDIRVSVGDNATTNTIFATVTNTVSYKVEIPFTAKILDNEIQEVDVYYRNNRIEAEIASIAEYTYKDAFSNELVDVVLAFSTDISLPDNSTVTSIIKLDPITYSSVGDAKPYFAETEPIMAEIPGEILELYMTDKQSVKEGDLVAVIDGESIDSVSDSLNNQIESLENQIDNANDMIDSYYENIDAYYEDIAELNDDIENLLDDIAEIEADVDEAKEGYENANVIAEFDGYVTGLNVVAGDSVGLNTALFTLISIDNPKMKVAIDELDIAEIKVGQEVTVVIDALADTEETPMQAIVTAIDIEGDYQGGVTTYDVTVTLLETPDGLRLSMNATATIYVSKSADTLYIPIEAVTLLNGKSFVYVEDASVTGAPIRDIQTEVDKDTDSPEAAGTGSGGGKGGRDPSTMTEEELAAFKERLAEKGMTLEDVRNKTVPTGDDTEVTDYYSGTRMVEVTTGIYNALYIEILDGLSIGDVVVLPPLYTSSDTSTSSDGSKLMGIPGIPGSGGGRPAGSLPGGGK